MNLPLGALITALLAANLLTAMFLFGIRQAFQVQKTSDLSWNAIVQMLVPLLFLAGGAYVYW